MIPRRFLRDCSGAAAAEFVLVLPMAIALLFGGMEAGNFIWNQHKLTDAVRDGARYAARMPVTDFCNGATLVMTNAKRDQIKLMTRTGQIADTNARSRVRGWTDTGVTVTPNCQSFVATGIYGDLGGAGPIVTVAATNVAYPSMFQALGFLKSTISLNAKANAPVIGI